MVHYDKHWNVEISPRSRSHWEGAGGNMNRAEFTTWRRGPSIDPDRARVLLKPFVPGDDRRIKGILKRVTAINDPEAKVILDAVRKEFDGRHRDQNAAFESRFENMKRLLPAKFKPSDAQRLLIGAYFCCEYSLEAAALFNPSIVPHPDQAEVPGGSLRFIMSLRATGEGHISSIEFRSGLVDSRGDVTVDPPGRFVTMAKVDPDPSHARTDIERMLKDEGCLDTVTKGLLRSVPESFKRSHLRTKIAAYKRSHARMSERQTQSLAWAEALLDLNYAFSFSIDQPLSERAIFPVSSFESNGIEDARFVKFVEDDGVATYYATYTAYNGRAIMPLMVATRDFLQFKIRSLSGRAARNKGMALFPRKIKGKYAVISRQDAESLYLVYSDRVDRWDRPSVLLKPAYPWEFLQIGNCGSPIEVGAGWLLLTHGVGPMRKYCIGAILLDKNDPSRILKRLRDPLIAPDATEREGYVPNVVYTCGALVHNGRLVIPYAMSDSATRIASVEVKELLEKMVEH